VEISEVRRRIVQTIERAKRRSTDRRARADEAQRDYEVFLEQTAVPLFRQAAQVLKAEGHSFDVFTPGGSVRLASARGGEDFIELLLDTSGAEPAVMGHVSRGRGRRLVETEQPLSEGRIRDLTDEDVLAFLARELEAFVER
jgi:hypothetical protein